MNRKEYDEALYLAHHGVKGQRWGHRRYQNEDGSYKSGAEGRYDPDTEGNKQHKSIGSSAIRSVKSKINNVDWKKAAKVGAAVAGTALVAYGTYKIAKNAKMIGRGINMLREQGHEWKRSNLQYEAGKKTLDSMFKKDSGYDPLEDKNQAILNRAIGEAQQKAVNDYNARLGTKNISTLGGSGNHIQREVSEYLRAKYKHDAGEGPAPKELSAKGLALLKEREQRNEKSFLELVKKDPSWNEYLSKERPSTSTNSVPSLSLNTSSKTESGTDYNAKLMQTLNTMRQMAANQNGASVDYTKKRRK